MRKSILATAGVAILGVVALSACDFSFGKKGDTPGGESQSATGGAASGGEGGGAATEGTSGKPEDAGAGGAGGASGAAEEGPKPDDQASGEAAGGAPAGGGATGGAPAGGGSGPRVVGEIHEGFDQQISSYLDHYASQFGQGFGPSGVQDVVTGLQGGREYRWDVGTLRGGQTYTFLGACDQDCSDVDLIIEDGNGIEVGQDLLTDDYPVVTITPRTDGPFTARILLVNCSVEPCYVGGRLLQQR